MDQNASLSVSGTFKATGATFTWADGQNPWNGITFNGDGASGSKLENCVIQHVNSMPVNINKSSPTITGCTIGDGSATYGVYVYSDDYQHVAKPVITNNTISGTQYGIYVSGPNMPTVTGNTLSNNLSYGLYNSSSIIIYARFNNWGVTSGPLDNSDDRTRGGWYNPNGKGDRVSDRVMYDPWLGKAVTVTLTVQGSGKGTVTSDPAGIASNVSTTSTAFGYGDNLLLSAKADEYHLFSGWSGGCTNPTGDCVMTLTGDLSVTATFDPDTSHAARLNRPTPVYYPTLLEAYTNAVSGDTIQSWATTYEEVLTLNGNKRVTFSGGYDQGYTSIKGKTGVSGRLTLSNGVTTLENIEVR